MSLAHYPKLRPVSLPWLAQVPEHWPVMPLGYRYEVALGKMLDGKRVSGQHLAPYLRNTDVQWDSINVDDLPEMDFAPHEQSRYSLKPGDLLVCEGGEVGRCAIWTGQLRRCYYQKALHRLRPRNTRFDSPRFVMYLLRAASASGVLTGENGRATIAHLPAETLRAYRFAFPPLDEQDAIATFLDRETAKIDALVAEQERLTALLREQRESAISEAVTRGVRGNRRFLPSGIKWLGDIPEDWSAVQSRRLFRVRNEPARTTDRQLTASQKYGMLLQSEFMELEGRRVVQVIAGTDTLRHAEPNDFIISLRSFQGGIEWCKLPGSVTFHYVVLVPNVAVHPPYFAWLFKSQPYIQALRTTTDLIRDGQDLRWSHFVQVPLPVVPLGEQREIAHHLASVTTRIDTLLAEAEEMIALLKERRAALISAAVTGQIDVRGLVAA